MEQGKNVDVLFLGTLDSGSDSTRNDLNEKSAHYDEISFNDPVSVELLRIPHGDKQMYSRFTSKTQKTPIKGFEVYYRNLASKTSRFSLMVSYSSELLASETDDILITLKETIFTDLLVIRGDFKSITLCIYGRVIRDPEEIQKNCPWFKADMPVSLQEEKPIYKIQRDIFNESSRMVKAIEDSYSGQTRSLSLETLYKGDIFSNDDELHEQQIQNITLLSQQLLQQFLGETQSSEQFLVDIRMGMEQIQSHLAKLFKSAHIGLYYPSSYRTSNIPDKISLNVTQIAFKSLSFTLSDQCRALEVLKLILQLAPHAKIFVNLGGVSSLIKLFVDFFKPESIILSSFKALLVEVLIALSFWDFAANCFVKKINDSYYFSLFTEGKISQNNERSSNEKKMKKEKSSERERSRTREKKKKKSRSYDRSCSEKRDKKSKKDKKKDKKKDREKDRRDRSKDRGKERKKDRKQERKSDNKESSHKGSFQVQKVQFEELSFYEIIIKMIMKERNTKLLTLFKIFLEQITQTLTKNKQLSDHMAYYTPLLRDTKYMFNQGGELISSRPLKIFASFQPFLNDEQSKGVSSKYICQGEKIRQAEKYGISPQLFKVLDSIQNTILLKEEDGIGYLYDEEFITSMSALLRFNDGSIAIGFSSFLDALKVESLLTLKKQQAVISIICEYIYKVLLEDDGINTVLYTDQIHSSMLKLSTYIRQDKTFSKEIKRKVRFLKNYVVSFDYFNGADNNFKNLADYFLKLIRYDHYEINKIKEYHNKEYQKSTNPLNILNLEENINFGSFFDLLPSQPLLQIDVCLKIFLVLIKFNRNIWLGFYENKLSCGFSSLFLRIHSLVKFYLTPSLERQKTFVDVKFYEQLVGNFISVCKKLVEIFVHKVRYEGAFNDLLEEEDNVFDSVEIYQKIVEVFVVINNAYHSEESFITDPLIRQKMKSIIQLVIEFFDILCKSFEATKHQSRETKIKSILKYINHLHYESISNRSSVLHLLQNFIRSSENNLIEIIKSILFQGGMQKTQAVDDSLLPDNEYAAIENIFRLNMYRFDPSVKQGLVLLIEVCLQKDKLKDQAIRILENLYEGSETLLKEELQEFERKPHTLQKLTMFIFLLSMVKSSTSKLDDRIFRFFKYVENIRDTGGKNQFDLCKLKLRNILIKYMQNSFTTNKNSPLISQFLKLTSTFLVIEISGVFSLENLRSCLYSLQALIQVSENCFYQSHILYGQFLAKPYKSACEISLFKIFNYFTTGQFQKGMIEEEQQELIRKIGISAFYLLCKLTTIDSCEFFSTETRKNALQALISEDKSITFQDLFTHLEPIVPHQLIFMMKNYLTFPIAQKEQTLPQNENESTSQGKLIGSYFSKSVFSMISQGDPVSKMRFQYVQEKWEGGDMEKGIYRIDNRKNYEKLAEEVLILKKQITDTKGLDFFYEYNQQNERIKNSDQLRNPFYNLIARKTFAAQKKNPIDSAINLKKIPSSYLPKEPVTEIKPQILEKTVAQNPPRLTPGQSPINPKITPTPPIGGIQRSNSPQVRSNSAGRSQPPPPMPTMKPPSSMPPAGYPNVQQPMPNPPQNYTQPMHHHQPHQPHQPLQPHQYQQPMHGSVYPGSRGYQPPQNSYYQHQPQQGYNNYGQQMGYGRGMINPNMSPYYNNTAQYHNHAQPSEQHLYKESINLIYQLKQKPEGPIAQQQKQRLNQILRTYPSVSHRVNEYLSSYKK